MSKNTRRASAAFKGISADVPSTAPKASTRPAPATTSQREKTSKYTLLLSDDDALLWDQLAMDLRRDLGRKVDKSAMVRALVYLAAEDESLRRQLVETLDREGVTA